MKKNNMINKTFIKNIYSGKKSIHFINLKKKFKYKSIPNNLIYDKDLNIIRLQPNPILKKKNNEFWKNFNYDDPKFYTASTPYQEQRNKFIINNILKIKKIKKILDFGSGDTTFLKKLSLFKKTNYFFGYDQNVKNSNINEINNKKIIIMTKKKMKENAPYDLIFLNWVISNSYEPWKIFNLCKNLLKKQGYLIVTESNVMLNKQYPRKRNSYFKMADIKANQFCRPFHFTNFEIKNLMELNSFKVIKEVFSNKYNFKIFMAKKKNCNKEISIKTNNNKEYLKFMKIFFK